MSPPPEPPADRESAFRDLYVQTYADLLRFAQRRVHPSHAEDVVADAFLVAWRRFDDLPDDAARPWLYGICRHVILNDRRGGSRRDALAVRIAEACRAPGASDDTELIDRCLELATVWRRLSEVHQEALALTAWEGLSAAEAATVLDISPVAYRLRLSRARRALRAHLGHLPVPHPVPARADAARRSEESLR